MSRDWVAWHRDYDDAESGLAQRLDVVRTHVRQILAERPAGEFSVLSLCAGDGRDLLPVIAESPLRDSVSATLVELDRTLARRAVRSAETLGLHGVAVRTADAGLVGSWLDVVPVDLVMLCGLFGNMTMDDVQTTIAVTRGAVRPGGQVLWTRGRRQGSTADPALEVRRLFVDHGYSEIDYTSPEDARFRVGRARYDGPPTALPTASTQVFAFTD